MTTEMKLSIVVPVFNGEKFIEETLNSVIRNTQNLQAEIIVVNDGSKDQTSFVLDKFANRVKLIEQENSGEAAAVNRGIRASESEFTLVLSADDLCPEPELFLEAFKVFRSSPDVQCVYPDWKMINEKGEVIHTIQTQDFSYIRMLENFDCLPGPGSIFRTESFRVVGGRDVKVKFLSDYEFWLRLGQVGAFKRIPRNLAYWRSHPESTTIKQRSLSMALERIQVMENFFQLNPQLDQCKNKSMSNVFYSCALLSYYSKGIPAKQFLLRSVFKEPTSIFRRNFLQVSFILLVPISKLGLSSFLTLKSSMKRLVRL
jgi:glycosyltransferase involved in cell wall biosynthesis